MRLGVSWIALATRLTLKRRVRCISRFGVAVEIKLRSYMKRWCWLVVDPAGGVRQQRLQIIRR